LGLRHWQKNGNNIGRKGNLEKGRERFPEKLGKKRLTARLETLAVAMKRKTRDTKKSSDRNGHEEVRCRLGYQDLGTEENHRNDCLGEQGWGSAKKGLRGVLFKKINTPRAWQICPARQREICNSS